MFAELALDSVGLNENGLINFGFSSLMLSKINHKIQIQE